MLYFYILISIFSIASIITSIVTIIIEIKKSKVSQAIMKPDILMKYERILDNYLKSKEISLQDDMTNSQKVDLMKLCQSLNIEVRKKPRMNTRLNDVEAEINHSENGSYVVNVAENLSLKQYRFAIAHEIGHVVMGDNLPVKRNGHGIFIRSEEEQIRDYIAAAILLPMDMFSKQIENAKFYSLEDKQKKEFIATMSEMLDVDESVVIKRIKECKLLAEARS